MTPLHNSHPTEIRIRGRRGDFGWFILGFIVAMIALVFLVIRTSAPLFLFPPTPTPKQRLKGADLFMRMPLQSQKIPNPKICPRDKTKERAA
jgi:hypothetical protein